MTSEELCKQMETALEDEMPGCKIPVEEKMMNEGYDLSHIFAAEPPTEPSYEACRDEGGQLMTVDEDANLKKTNRESSRQDLPRQSQEIKGDKKWVRAEGTGENIKETRRAGGAHLLRF